MTTSRCPERHRTWILVTFANFFAHNMERVHGMRSIRKPECKRKLRLRGCKQLFRTVPLRLCGRSPNATQQKNAQGKKLGRAQMTSVQIERIFMERFLPVTKVAGFARGCATPPIHVRKQRRKRLEFRYHQATCRPPFGGSARECALPAQNEAGISRAGGQHASQRGLRRPPRTRMRGCRI